ncbi:sigma factor [Phytomonospora sp. NPDC050363]|uniref:sigma factor n=1 Tax=Phytomonospora sp. NPDC050363 TaxID=3155642 RepID=UPI0033EED562
MNPEHEFLSERFTAARPRLHAVAHRMLGSAAEAGEALDEAWLRLSLAGENGLDTWLTTLVGRVCLDRLHGRRGSTRPERAPGRHTAAADSVGLALLMVLETLEADEGLAFVLHDVFALGFGKIGEVLGRTPAEASALAAGARRRLRGGARGGIDGQL